MTLTSEPNATLPIINRGNISEGYLHRLDLFGYLVAAIITLGPLAATAAFS